MPTTRFRDIIFILIKPTGIDFWLSMTPSPWRSKTSWPIAITSNWNRELSLSWPNSALDRCERQLDQDEMSIGLLAYHKRKTIKHSSSGDLSSSVVFPVKVTILYFGIPTLICLMRRGRKYTLRYYLFVVNNDKKMQRFGGTETVLHSMTWLFLTRYVSCTGWSKFYGHRKSTDFRFNLNAQNYCD